MRILLAFIVGLVILVACKSSNPEVVIDTELGSIRLELYEKKAPVSVHNFLTLIQNGRYTNAEFYRVVTLNNQPGRKIKIEVIQGGIEFTGKIDTIPGILHETTEKSGIHHTNGTISLARDKPGTASTEFFICIGDQPELDFGGRRNPDGQGFAAFGKVVEGMDVVRKIQQLPADSGQVLLKKVKFLKVYRSGSRKDAGRMQENAGKRQVRQ